MAVTRSEHADRALALVLSKMDGPIWTYCGRGAAWADCRAMIDHADGCWLTVRPPGPINEPPAVWGFSTSELMPDGLSSIHAMNPAGAAGLFLHLLANVPGTSEPALGVARVDVCQRWQKLLGDLLKLPNVGLAAPAAT